MHFLKHWSLAILLLFGLSVVITSCNNDDEPEPVLSITSFTPTTAPVGSTITITGTNFNATSASNKVLFGTAEAPIISASPTQLVVTVPAGAVDGPITVQANSQSAVSTSSFTRGAKPVVTVVGSISTNTTWNANTVYEIRGFVYVRNNVTLTIEPGTIIKGGGRDEDPTGQNKGGTLIVTQGSKLEAKGTSARPIVFTSKKAAGQRNYGDWGGIVLIGKAPHNRLVSQQLEGGIEGQLGAFNEPTDNSGTMQYVRIEFPGISLVGASGSEINGLTLYGVGSGTTLDHIQVSYSGDDSFEWFGGTVNAKYLVAHRGFDDDFDTDWGFIGKVQFGLSLRDPEVADVSGSNCFESDNFAGQGEPATAANNGLPLTQPIFANISGFAFSGTPSTANAARGSGPFQSAMHLRRNTAISIYNSVFSGWPEGLRLDGTATATLANLNSGKLELQGLVLANTLVPVRGVVVAGGSVITNDQAITYYGLAARKNVIVTSTDIATLLFNAQNFNLTAPNFLPGAASPLLVAGNAATGGKIADAFFSPAPYRGAFGTENWTAGWTNFDPQTTNYDR